MEIDKQQLVKLIEAIFDTTHVFECELALYRLIVQTLCQQQGLEPENIVELARVNAGAEIREKYEPSRQNLLERVPQLVDLLNSNQDEFLALLRAWKPQGPIN